MIESMNQIICPECNNNCSADDEVCKNCGFPIKEHYMDMSKDDLLHDEHEVTNGKIKCPECNAICDLGSKICHNCGFPFDDVSSEESDFKNNNSAVSPNDNKRIMQHYGAKVRCPKCGSDTYSEDETCENCGFFVKSYFEKENKRKLSDIIDDFSFEDVKEYASYIYNDARNTIKIMALSTIILFVFFVIELFQIITKARVLVDNVKSYIDTKALMVSSGNNNLDNMKTTYTSLIVSSGIKLGITLMLLILSLVGVIKLIKILKKDYE